MRRTQGGRPPIRLLWPAALLLVAGCADDTSRGAPAAHVPPEAVRSTQAPVAHRSDAHAPRCSAGDLVVRFRPEGDGAGGHGVALLDFRNVGSSRCLLTGYPRRVTLSEPGRRAVTATDGSFFPVARSAPMEHGGVTTLGLETDTSCPARPGGGPAGPMYHEVAIALRGGVLRVDAPRGGLDVGCGVHLTRFTRWQ